MWIAINNHDMIRVIKQGDIITNEPEATDVEYVIDRILLGDIKIVYAKGLFAVRIFPGEELLSEKWWVKAHA